MSHLLSFPLGDNLRLIYLLQLNDLIGFIVAFAALKVGIPVLTRYFPSLTQTRFLPKRTHLKTCPLAGRGPDFSVLSSTASSFLRWALVYSYNP